MPLTIDAGLLVRGAIRDYLSQEAFFRGVKFTERKHFLSSVFYVKAEDSSIRSIASVVDAYFKRYESET